jgi:hypothetical protein
VQRGGRTHGAVAVPSPIFYCDRLCGLEEQPEVNCTTDMPRVLHICFVFFRILLVSWVQDVLN